MNLSILFPPEIVQWLVRYGTFVVLLFFSLVVLALLMRPFWLWYSGRTETADRLKRMEENSRKALLELEILNHTLAIPIKRAGQKSKAAEPVPEEPMVVTQQAKDAFLKVLENSRKSIREEAEKEADSPTKE